MWDDWTGDRDAPRTVRDELQAARGVGNAANVTADREVFVNLNPNPVRPGTRRVRVDLDVLGPHDRDGGGPADKVTVEPGGDDPGDIRNELKLLSKVAHDTAQVVARTDEAGNPETDRLVVHRRGRADLLDAAGAHDHNAVRHRERLLLIVRDVHERHAELRLQLA